MDLFTDHTRVIIVSVVFPGQSVPIELQIIIIKLYNRFLRILYGIGTEIDSKLGYSPR